MALITKSEIQDLINKINNQIPLRKNSNLNVISDIVDNTSISYSKMNDLNTYRRTLASKNRYAGCSTVTCGSVGTGAPSEWNGSDLTVYTPSGETPLAQGNIAWATQLNILKSDITNLNNMCACNTYRADYGCDCESYCLCESQTCTFNCSCDTYCGCDEYCDCESYCTCNTTCSCQSQSLPCDCVRVCGADGYCPVDYWCRCQSQSCPSNCDCHGDVVSCICDDVCTCETQCDCESQSTCGCDEDCDCEHVCTCNYNCVEFYSR